jgi:hypothetical protein
VAAWDKVMNLDRFDRPDVEHGPDAREQGASRERLRQALHAFVHAASPRR